MRKPIPQADDIRELLRASVDSRRVSVLEKMSRFALTGVWEARGRGYGLALGSTWPWYPDLDPEWVEGGRSNKIFNANRQKKSRLMTGEVEPDSEGPSQFTSSARKAWFKERNAGAGNGDPWRPHTFAYFDDFDLNGTGCNYFALTQNPESGKYACAMKNLPMQHVVYSRLARNPINSPWVCVRHIVPFEQAKEMYPNAAVEAKEFMEGYGHDLPLPIVVVYEYYDIGTSSTAPCRMVWLKDWAGDPVKKERNPWGRFLPVSFMVNNLLPGARYPTGGVFTMLKTQMVINEFEKGLLSRQKNGPVRVWNDSKLNNDDTNRYFQGLTSNVRLATGESAAMLDNLVFQLAGQSLSNADVEGLSHFEQQFGEDAALTEIDQNSVLNSQRTLGEIQQMQAAGASNRAFDDQNTKEGLIMMVKKAFHVAKTGDDDPVEVTVVLPDQRKRKMVVNMDDASSCAELFKEQANITIDVSNLTAVDTTTKRMNRLASLEKLLEFITLDPALAQKYGDKLAQEAIQAIGEDPDEWAQASPALQAMAQGQPVTPGTPMQSPGQGMRPMGAQVPQLA